MKIELSVITSACLWREPRTEVFLGAGERSTEKERRSSPSIDVPDGRPISGVSCDNVMVI